MHLTHFIRQDMRQRWFRSALIAGLVMTLSFFLLLATLSLSGLRSSLKTGLERLGADIIVVPYGACDPYSESALFRGALVTFNIPFERWMTGDKLEQVKGISGVAVASPQLFLKPLVNAAPPQGGGVFLIAFDPVTDFTIRSWLRKPLSSPLGLGEAIAGASVSAPVGSNVNVHGHDLKVVGKLAAMDTALDQSLLITFDTAYTIAERAPDVLPPSMPKDGLSTIMVKVKPGYNIEHVAAELVITAPGIWSVRSPSFIRLIQGQRAGLIHILFQGTFYIWMLVLILVGLLFSLVINERRREIGMLRAVGATRKFIFKLFLAEGSCLALVGGIFGVTVAIGSFHLFRRWLMTSFSIPLLAPSLPVLVGATICCVLVTMVALLPSLLYTAIRASRTDPAVTMREV